MQNKQTPYNNDTRSRNQRDKLTHFMARISGTCVMQISDWISLVPDSGAD